MGKNTTRERVREVAEQFLASGQKISSRAICEITKGSLTTVTDELSKWQAEREASLAKGNSGSSANESLVPRVERESAASAAAVAPEPAPPGPQPFSNGLAAAIQAMATEMATLSGLVAALKDELFNTRESNATELARAYERYEAVQRHALVQADDARVAAGELRAKLKSVTLDFETREDAQRGKTQALREENASLRAKIEMFEQFAKKSSA